jgi:UDP-N-acetyl-D-glucosamine dehydrogenase
MSSLATITTQAQVQSTLAPVPSTPAPLHTLERKLDDGSARVAVVGLGYIGLPLTHTFWRAGIETIGFDIDPEKIAKLACSESYIAHFDSGLIEKMHKSGRFCVTGNFCRIADADVILICVPTPITPAREPDLRYVVATAETIAKYMKPQTLVVLESTTYPGTTTEIVLPILERSGLKSGRDFFLAFSPEREDPGSGIETHSIPKIVGGIDDSSGALAAKLYGLGFDTVHRVRDAKTAEAVKITENVFRAVNIALVNELKLAYGAMDIDIWEVIEAAKTKPFGYMPFYPGPGLGGHCIPIDPFYLAWRARNFEVETKFIELAGEINRAMPRLVVEKLAEALNARMGKALNGAHILVLGAAYKKDIDDTRESPALRLMDLVGARGAVVSYSDPHVPEILPTREHPQLCGLRSIALDEQSLSRFDAVLIATDHSAVDYAALVRHSRLIVDTRNATKGIKDRTKIVMA